MTALEAYAAFDAMYPKSTSWFDFDCAPREIGLDGNFTIEQLKEIIRLAEAVEREL